MGRPKLTEKQRRDKRFTIYVSADDEKRIERAAKSHGHAVATDWIRASIVSLANTVTR